MNISHRVSVLSLAVERTRSYTYNNPDLVEIDNDISTSKLFKRL